VSTGLKFNAKLHRYWLDGKVTPGVTTLLGKGLPKPAIPYWAAKSVAEYVITNPDEVAQLRLMGPGPAIAALKSVPWEARDKAAVRGTEVHALAEKVIHGTALDEVPAELAAHVQGYVDWLDRFDVSAVLTERNVASRQWGYCGTFDAVVTFGRGPWAGRTAMIDLKTSSGIYGETALQIAAYARADCYVSDDDQETPLPDVDCIGAAHVTDAGTAFYPLCADRAAIDEAFKVFSHVAFIAKRTDWIKGLVGQPMELDEVVA